MSVNPYPLSKRLAEMRWQNWLLDPVEWDESEWIPRQACLEVFVNAGLLPFLNAYGYVFQCDKYRIGECIARCIYYGGVRHRPLNTDYTDEDYEYYNFRMDDGTWEEFWSNWSLWIDVKGEHPRVRELIRYCVWTLLDIGNSDATADYGGGSSDSEEEEGKMQRRIDPYLQDAGNGYF